MKRSFTFSAMFLGLWLTFGCDNPESREAGEAIQEAVDKSGDALEASLEESRQATGEALEDAGQSIQPSESP